MYIKEVVMVPNFKVNPGIGIGAVRFGMYQNEVKEILGEPEEISEDTDFEEEVDITWYYNGGEFIACFDETDDYKLSLVEVDDNRVELFGQKLLGMSLEAAKKFLIENNITDLAEESLDDEIILSSSEFGFDFYFDDNRLNSVQLSPLYKDDNTIDWPDKKAALN